VSTVVYLNFYDIIIFYNVIIIDKLARTNFFSCSFDKHAFWTKKFTDATFFKKIFYLNWNMIDSKAKATDINLI